MRNSGSWPQKRARHMKVPANKALQATVPLRGPAPERRRCAPEKKNMRSVAVTLAALLSGCAASSSEFKTYGDTPCSNGTIPLVRIWAKVDEQWNGRIVRFRYNLPGHGKPESVSIVSADVPTDVAVRAQEAFEKSRFKPAVVEGKLMRQLGCEYDYVLPTGAQQGAPADPPRPAGSAGG